MGNSDSPAIPATPPPTAVSPRCCRHRAGSGSKEEQTSPRARARPLARALPRMWRGAWGAAGPGPGPRPGPGPARWARDRERGCRGPAREGCEPLRPGPDRTSFFTFHSSFSLTASSALPMVRQAAGRRHQVAPRSPRALSPLPRLPTQRPTRQAEPPPAALPACSRRSHCPVLSSAAIFRAPQTSGGRPGPFPRPAGRGCVRRDWGGGGSRRVRTPGGVGPGRAPLGRLSWRPACSRPEGANPHCERWEPASCRALRGGRAWVGKGACVWANLNRSERSLLLAPRRGARGLGSGSLWFESGPVTPPDLVACR